MKLTTTLMLGISAGAIANAFTPVFTEQWIWLYVGICTGGIFLKMDWK